MQVGMVGLGRMGASMARRLLHAGHVVVAHDREAAAVRAVADAGAHGAASLETLVSALAPPRTVWVMVPAGSATESTVRALGELLAADDVLVDGGNSHYRDSIARAELLRERRVQFADVGTSGGIWGADDGYCLMAGGDAATVERIRPLLESLAPAPGRGWAHVGPTGAGHFVKMIHNGIEYGMMQAIAEGFSIMARDGRFELDLRQVAELWRHGSVVRSWLLDLTGRALAADASLEGIAPMVADSGEGRWTVAEAIALDVPAPVITQALIARLRSRDATSFADRLLAALRQQFGGHAVARAADGITPDE